MKTKEEVIEMLDSLQWKRFTKKSLQKFLQEFFGTKNKLENSTEPDEKELDYSFVFTTAEEPLVFNNYIDIEIFYAKTRSNIIITEAELLDYQ